MEPEDEQEKIIFRVGDLVHEAYRPNVLGLVIGTTNGSLIVNWISENSNSYSQQSGGPEILESHYVTLIQRGDHEE